MATDTSIDHIHTETLRSIDGMIFGSKAHALLAKFWPTAGDSADYPELAEQARLMNALPKYVLTHGKETTGWANSHAIGAEDLARLKAESLRPIALFAGAKAVQTGMESGLVDEIRLIRYPILLGRGTPLFRNDDKRRSLTLIGSETFGSGAMLDRYRFKGA